MSNSFKFNGIDLSAYGLVVLSNPTLGAELRADIIQLPDVALAAQSAKVPKRIELEILVQAATHTQLLSYLDSIKSVVAKRDAKQLILDIQSGRYWTARFETMEGELINPAAYRGSLIFIADDPLAYDVSAESSDFNIDADPDTVVEAVGGTGYVNPSYTLVAGENLGLITLKVENETTSEELQYKGTVGNGETVIIDVAKWVVTLEGVEDMAEVSGEFPRLQPGANNSIKVTGFGTTGTLNIAYRKTYL